MTYEGHADQNLGHTTFSQNGEDLVILNLLKQVNWAPGNAYTWIDVGAHHPVNISNTKLLYDFGYRGINIDANPALLAAFEEQRPEDLNLSIGIGAHAGFATFYMYDEASGRNTFCKGEVDDSPHLGLSVTRTPTLDIVPLDSVVATHCDGLYPPLLLIDTEGWDYEILCTSWFKNHRPNILCVETREGDTYRMTKMLDNKGYVLLLRMGENLIFAHRGVARDMGVL